MKKVKKLSISIGLWLSVCVLSLTFIAHANAAESAIIYEYKTITQKKGEAFSSFLEKAGLNRAEKKLVDDIPIFHKAHSNRQFRFAYQIEKGKKKLKEVRVTRGNRLANFVLSKKNGKVAFVQYPSQIPSTATVRKVTLQSTTTDKIKPQSQQSSVKKDTRTNVIVVKPTRLNVDSIIPRDLIGVSFHQAKGQSLDQALSVAKLSKLQENIIKGGNYLKTAKSQRTFNLYFTMDGNKRLLKGVRIVRNKSEADFFVKDVGDRFQLVSLKKLDNSTRRQWERVFAKAKLTAIKSAPISHSSKSSSAKKSSGKYQVLSITQKKGQSLYSALKTVRLTSAQRNLIITMPATKSAKTTRKIYVLLESNYLRGLRIVRGRNVAEYVLFKYKGKWTWANEKGQINSNSKSTRRVGRFPLHYIRVSSPYNPRRRHPISRRIRPHKGIDLKARHGTPIYAPANGVVRFSGRQRGYGITLEIDHQNGYRTKYAHLSRIMRSARRGRYVKKGQMVARVGNTGYSTGAHLHYEVIVNGRHRNPAYVRVPSSGRSSSGGAKTLSAAKKAVRQYLPILRRLSR